MEAQKEKKRFKTGRPKAVIDWAKVDRYLQALLETKEEVGDDLIIWFYNKYKQQQESVNQTDGSTEGKEEV